ncbi:MAG TPA: nucleotidyltransferase family protein, partial [Herpetosiphonaceae bacterium]
QTEPWPADGRARQLRPGAHLLYLAAHLMLQHGEEQPRLIWCYDLHLLLERHGAALDWPELIERASAFRWAGALHAALLHARAAFGTPLPESALAALAAAISPAERRFLDRKRQAVRSQGMDQWLKLATLSWPARLRMILGLLLPSRAYLAWRYRLRPAWLWPAAYPFHWARMAAEGLATLARLARRRSQGDRS